MQPILEAGPETQWIHVPHLITLLLPSVVIHSERCRRRTHPHGALCISAFEHDPHECARIGKTRTANGHAGQCPDDVVAQHGCYLHLHAHQQEWITVAHHDATIEAIMVHTAILLYRQHHSVSRSVIAPVLDRMLS